MITAFPQEIQRAVRIGTGQAKTGHKISVRCYSTPVTQTQDKKQNAQNKGPPICHEVTPDVLPLPNQGFIVMTASSGFATYTSIPELSLNRSTKELVRCSSIRYTTSSKVDISVSVAPHHRHRVTLTSSSHYVAKTCHTVIPH